MRQAACLTLLCANAFFWSARCSLAESYFLVGDVMKWVRFSRSFAVLALAIFVIMPLEARSQQPPVKFKKKATYDSGGYAANSVALSDLNGDGHLDLIVANGCPSVECSNANEGVVSVRLGNGNGTFQAPNNYASGGNRATSVAAGDLNGDGKPELAVADRCRHRH